jgi:CRISPR-associated protein Cas2
MIILTYDISNNKVRTKFSKFLQKYGRKLQYSVYEIRNSKRILQNILREVELRYEKHFSGSDSVLIFQLCEQDKKKIIRYGYSENDTEDVVFFS